jgi:hypothetical protein
MPFAFPLSLLRNSVANFFLNKPFTSPKTPSVENPIINLASLYSTAL